MREYKERRFKPIKYKGHTIEVEPSKRFYLYKELLDIYIDGHLFYPTSEYMHDVVITYHNAIRKAKEYIDSLKVK